MESTLTFTLDELTAAFALLMPPDRARSLAREWFVDFGSDAELTASYVHNGAWGPSRPVEPSAPVVPRPEWDAPEVVSQDEELFLKCGDDDLRALLMGRLGETHLALLALVNDNLYERMRQVRFFTNTGAARNRLQLTRAVRAYRQARGLPPAV